MPTDSRTVPGVIADQSALLGRQVARLLHLRRDDQRFGRAEARRDREQLERLGKPAARREPARDVEADDAAEVLHLARRQLMARIVREPGIRHALDRRVRTEELRDALRAAALRVAAHEDRSADRAA